jgi:predicted DNA-binding protein
MNTKNEQSRMTIDIPKESHKRLKMIAAGTGKSMRDVVLDAIDIHLEQFKTPNKKTLKAIKNANERKNLTEYKDIEDFFKKMGI